MSRIISPIAGKPYGLAAVCRAWRLARSGVYRPLSAPALSPAQRRGPLGAMSDEALTTAIRDVLAASPFHHGEGHRKVWARLRHAGTRTSLRRVLRLLRGGDLETVSRELGVTAATLSGWRDAFLAGGEAALTSRAATGEELESERLKAKLGAALIERDLLNEKIALLEADRPFARRRRKL